MGMRAFDAICLDVGGVFVVPDHETVAGLLSDAGLTFDRERFGIGHYLAMTEVDHARSVAEDFTEYERRFAREVGIGEDELATAVDALHETFSGAHLWRQPLPQSTEALRKLVDRGVRVAIVSNSDGTVEELLRKARICQVGDGDSCPVEVIVDSTVVGVAKPDPAIFAHALAALGTAPGRTLHVGDSVHYDVGGARAAGLHPVHFDPYDLCHEDDHDHIAQLTELDRYL
jgi:putative hydrolase of the HAD superfamily